jgi:transcriptional regulator with XRE-family HTH domain
VTTRNDPVKNSLVFSVLQMVAMALSDKIKEARQAKHLSQEKLAQKAGIGRSALAQYEAGRTNPSIETLKGIARALDMSWVRLIDADAAAALVEKPGDKSANLGDEVPLPEHELENVPIYGAISAHTSEYSESDVISYERLPKAAGGRIQWGRKVRGTCMQTEFEDGDIAIFENLPFEDGHAVHAFTEGAKTFKIYRLIDGQPQLWPMNTGDGSAPIIPMDGVWTIRGVCTKRIRRAGPSGEYRDTRDYPGGFRYRVF